MRVKLTLALLSCVVMFAYVSNAKQKQQPGVDRLMETIEENNKIEFTSQNRSTFGEEQWREWPEEVNRGATLKPPIPVNPSNDGKTAQKYPETSFYGEREPFVVQPHISPNPSYEKVGISQGSYMTLTPTNTTNALGNPIYELRLYGNGELLGTYQTVTGRANTQHKNRHQAGTEAPLPNGKYRVGSTEVAGTHPEVGGRFLPIEPLFATGRSALGIHYDPSFQKNNGEDGTEGCIALTNKRDLDQVLQYVHSYQPQYLEVRLQV